MPCTGLESAGAPSFVEVVEGDEASIPGAVSANAATGEVKMQLNKACL